MAEVLRLPSPPSSDSAPSPPPPSHCVPQTMESAGAIGSDTEEPGRDEQRRNGDHHSFLALLFAIFRKSLVTCSCERKQRCGMEIGSPSDVRHICHVTFDRFNGFLGLPAEFEPVVPVRAPSASANVFGVSTESMQLSYDSKGNIVPTVLQLMQQHLYDGGGLQAEGIFRINADNRQEEYVRDQLSRGVVPEGVDVHCLAGLIKAWFREMPKAVLDSISPDEVMQCSTEEACMELVKDLPPTEASLLDWAINLMADVAQMEHFNKMNAHNIAMVFAPNMTQMADPFTALMYAVQVTNFLATLVRRTLRLREEAVMVPEACLDSAHLVENHTHESPSTPKPGLEDNEEDTEDPVVVEEPSLQQNSISSDQNTAVSQGHSCHSNAASSVFFNEAEAEKCEIPVENDMDERVEGEQPLSEITRHVKSSGAKSMTQEELMTARIEAWD